MEQMSCGQPRQKKRSHAWCAKLQITDQDNITEILRDVFSSHYTIREIPKKGEPNAS